MLCAKKKRNDCKLSLGSNHCFSNKPDLSIKHEIIKYFSAPSQKTSECCRGSRRGRAATGGGCGQRVKGGEKYSSSAAGAGSGLVMILCHICWTRLFNQLLHTIQIFLNLQIFLYDLSESGQECEVTHFRKLACTIINGLLGFKLINHLSSHSTLYSLHTNNNIKLQNSCYTSFQAAELLLLLPRVQGWTNLNERPAAACCRPARVTSTATDALQTASS